MTLTRTKLYNSGMSKERWGEGNTYLRGKTYWMHYQAGGKTHRESCKTDSEAKARKMLRARLNAVDRGEVVGAGVQKTSVANLLELLVEDYRREQKSVAWAKIVQKHLLSVFEYHKATKIGTAQIDAYILKRRTDGVGNSTINRELSLLRHAFYLGSRTEPPMVARVPKIPKLAEGSARQGFIDETALDALVKELPVEVGQVARFAYWTGCRKAEMLGMRWDWVDLNAAVVMLPASITKSGEGRVLPLVPELVELLTAMKSERDEYFARCPWVFNRAGSQIRDFYASWASASERAGLKGILLHDLRRSFVRNAVRAGIAAELGIVIGNLKRFPGDHKAHEQALTELMEKLK